MQPKNASHRTAAKQESPVPAVIIAALAAVALGAIGTALISLFSEGSICWVATGVLPLTTVIGAVMGLWYRSLGQDDWSGFRKRLQSVRGAVVFLVALSAVGWYMSFSAEDSGLDEYGCVIGEQLWCEVSNVCYVPWEGMCGQSANVDGFNIMKKIKKYSGLSMSPPVQDSFTWFEENGDKVMPMTVSGMVSRLEGVDIAKLEIAIIKAGLSPDQANTGRIGGGEMRGYRMLQTLVCSVASIDGGTEKLNATFSCGRINK